MRDLTLTELDEVSGGNLAYAVLGLAAAGMAMAYVGGYNFKFSIGGGGLSISFVKAN
jgi:hypothetical protein